MQSLAILGALGRFYRRTVPRDWYRRRPFLPVPPAPYVRWRMDTAYGGSRPGSAEILRDVWQFGTWLAESEREAVRVKTGR